MVEDGAGDIWVGHLGGLFRHSSGRWRKWTAEGLEQPEVHSLTVDDRGRLLVGTRHAIVRSALTRITSASRCSTARPDRDDPVADISLNSGGSVWRTDRVHGVRGHVGRGQPAVPPEMARGQRLLRDRAGTLWVGTGGQGLWRVSERADGRLFVEQSTVTTGLLGNGVVSLFEDREGNIWAGTLDGLNRLTRYVATPITGPGPGQRHRDVAAGHLGDDRRFAAALRPRPADRLPTIAQHRGEVKAIHADEAGRLWMSTRRWTLLVRRPRPARGFRCMTAASRTWRCSPRIAAAACGSTMPQRGLHRRSAVSIGRSALPPRFHGVRLAWMDTTAGRRAVGGHHRWTLIVIEPDGRTADYKASDGLDAGVVRAWHLDDDGSLWLAGVGGISRCSRTAPSPCPGKPTVTRSNSYRHHRRSPTGACGLRMRQRIASCHPGRSAPSTCERQASQCRWPSSTRPTAWRATHAGTGTAAPSWTISSACGSSPAVGCPSSILARIGAPTPVDARVDTSSSMATSVTHAGDAGRRAPRRLDIQFAALALTATPTTRASATVSTASIATGSTPAPHATRSTPISSPAVHVPCDGHQHRWNLARTAASWAFAAEPMFYQTVWFPVPVCWRRSSRSSPCGAYTCDACAPRCRFCSPSARVGPRDSRHAVAGPFRRRPSLRRHRRRGPRQRPAGQLAVPQHTPRRRTSTCARLASRSSACHCRRSGSRPCLGHPHHRRATQRRRRPCASTSPSAATSRLPADPPRSNSSASVRRPSSTPCGTPMPPPVRRTALRCRRHRAVVSDDGRARRA